MIDHEAAIGDAAAQLVSRVRELAVCDDWRSRVAALALPERERADLCAGIALERVRNATEAFRATVSRARPRPRGPRFQR
jgi:hypothetical protein